MIGLGDSLGQSVSQPIPLPLTVDDHAEVKWVELSRLRRLEELSPQCLAVVERMLAAQGDAAEPELVQLQHDLVETIRNQTE